MTPNDLPNKPRYILDTDTVTHQQLRREPVTSRIAAHGSTDVATTIVSMFEQLRGWLAEIHRARDERSLIAACAGLSRTCDYYCRTFVLPFDTSAAAVLRFFVAQRLRLGTQDLRIAAITLASDATLVTSNRRDFDRAPGLRIEDWTVA